MDHELEVFDSDIEHLAEIFVRTQNPASAALSYTLARKFQRAVPDVVQAEIDRFIGCIADAAEKVMLSQHIETPLIRFRESELYEAWRGGVENPIGALEREARDNWIFFSVLNLVGGGMKVGDAQAAVVKGSGIDVESIKRIWKRRKRAHNAVYSST